MINKNYIPWFVLDPDEVNTNGAARMIAEAGLCTFAAAKSRVHNGLFADAEKRGLAWQYASRISVLENDRYGTAHRNHKIIKKKYIENYIRKQLKKNAMEIVFDPTKLGFVPAEKAAKSVPETKLQSLDFMIWQGKKYFRSVDLEKISGLC